MKWAVTVVTLLLAIVAVFGQGINKAPTAASTPPFTTATPTQATTTTAPPTTTTAAPTTTTAAETTTEPAVTTTEAPATTTAPVPDKWVVYYSDDQTKPCLFVKMHLDFTIKDRKDKLTVPPTAKSSGECGTVNNPAPEQKLKLEWTPDGQKLVHTVDIAFNETHEPDKEAVVLLKDLKLNYALENETLVDSSLLHPMVHFAGNKSYQCEYGKRYSMTNENSVIASNVRVQAYMVDDKFGEPVICEEDQTNDIVPIAVGCALAALVIIVLIAYLIGRRRSRQQGYQSV